MPAILFAQYQVQVASGEPQTLNVQVPAYNDRIPAAIMNMKFDFNPDNETLLVTIGSGGAPSTNYDKVWLPQHEISYYELADYMKTRGLKLKKAQTYIDQENFLNLGSKPVAASIVCEGMTFTGHYELCSPKKVKKELDRQMVPLDGKMELRLAFNIIDNGSDLKLTLRNPMPLHRKGSKAVLDFVANDVVIDIQLDRCKESQPLLATIEEYLEIFKIGEAKWNNTIRGSKDLVKNLLNEQYAEIDLKRFENTGCAEIDEKCRELEACVQRFNGPPTSNQEKDKDKDKKKNKPAACGVSDSDVKATITKLNNLVNSWSMASTPAEKAEKKASFDATVKSFDAKLNSLSPDCKKKIEAKTLKDYEFVKKLIK